jgi:hypothetical protein
MFGKIAIIEFFLMLAMAGAGVSYFRYTEAQIATLHENNAKLETAVNTQQETIKAQQQAAAEQASQMVGLQQHMAEAESARRDFEDKLRQKDIGAMARANAADLEIRMNKATIQVLQDIINLTTPKDRQITPQQLQPYTAPVQTPTTPAVTATPAPAQQPAPQPKPVEVKTETTQPQSASQSSAPPAAIKPATTSSGQPAPRPAKTYGKSGQTQ